MEGDVESRREERRSVETITRRLHRIISFIYFTPLGALHKISCETINSRDVVFFYTLFVLVFSIIRKSEKDFFFFKKYVDRYCIFK